MWSLSSEVRNETTQMNINPADLLPKSVMWVSVTGWSVWLYALASAIYVSGAFSCYFYEDGKCWLVEIVAAVIFFMQGILDMVDFYRRKIYIDLDLADEQDSVNVFLERNKIILPLKTPSLTYEGSHSSLESLGSFGSSEESRSLVASEELRL